MIKAAKKSGCFAFIFSNQSAIKKKDACYSLQKT